MEEKLYFENSKGNKLCGILTRPGGDRDVPIMVLVHGFNSSKKSHTFTALADKLRKKGIASFRFDLFAHGESEGKFEDLTVTEAVDDTKRAIGFMRKLGFKKIGLMGSSFGGLSSFIAASQSEDLFALVQKAPVSTYLEIPKYMDQAFVLKWKNTGYRNIEGKRLKYAFYLDSIKHSAYEMADKIKAPTLIIHGNLDQDVPVGQSITVAKHIDNCALEIVVGADHRFTDPEHFKQMINSIVTFVSTHCH